MTARGFHTIIGDAVAAESVEFEIERDGIVSNLKVPLDE